MEFTKDDYVVEGNLEISVTYTDGYVTSLYGDKVIIKGGCIIVEHVASISLFNREVIQSINISFKEG